MKKSNLYFVQRVDGLVKVGISKNVPNRLRTLARSHGPLSVLKVAPGGKVEEAKLHSELRRHHQFGEWFTPHPEVLAAVANFVCDEPAVSIPHAKRDADPMEAECVERAAKYINSIIRSHVMQFGDVTHVEGLEIAAARHGLSYHALRHIQTGKAKTISAGLLERLRLAAISDMEAARDHLLGEVKRVGSL